MERNGSPIRGRSGKPRWHPAIRAHLPVCNPQGRGCNNKLAKHFEEPAKGPIRDLMYGRVQIVGPGEADAFARWALKTWLILAHPDLKPSDPAVTELNEGWDLTGLPDLYGWMTSGDPPPAGLHLWASRLDSRRAVAPYQAFFPPAARAFDSTWSFLAAGLLTFDLIFDPTETVEHPLEARGEAIRVWPLKAGATLDIGALPYASFGVRWTSVPFTGDVRILQHAMNP